MGALISVLLCGLAGVCSGRQKDRSLRCGAVEGLICAEISLNICSNLKLVRPESP